MTSSLITFVFLLMIGRLTYAEDFEICKKTSYLWSCPAGKYCQKDRGEATDTARCKDCPENSYCPRSIYNCRFSATTVCPDRRYFNIYTSCPKDHCSAIGSTSYLDCYVCCPAGKAFDPTNATCQDCPPGKYNDGTITECADCGAGTYSDKPGSIGCYSCSGSFISGIGFSACGCPVGQRSDGVSCLDCSAGTYNDVDGGTSCKPCQAGTYQADTKSAEWDKCPANTYSVIVGATSDVCITCDEGKHSSEGSSSCNNCEAGEYSPEHAASGCVQCPSGRYRTEEGGSSLEACLLCPVGKYNSVPGLSGLCEDCPAGRYASEAGLSECTPCGYGSYGKETGSSFPNCESCGAGYYLDQLGASVGEGSNPSNPCKKCPKGRYSTFWSVTNQENCLPCDAGKYTNEVGSQGCAPCPRGKFRGPIYGLQLPGSGRGLQQRPPSIHPALVPRSSFECYPCEAGKYAEQVQSAVCSECLPGTYINRPGAIACKLCEEGKTTLLTGQTVCTIDSPTSAPSVIPTSAPTSQKTSVTVAEQNAYLNMSDLISGEGLHLTGITSFKQIGYYPGLPYFLTVSVYDTGFGPPNEGEYTSFYINDEPLMLPLAESKDKSDHSNQHDEDNGDMDRRDMHLDAATQVAQNNSADQGPSVLRCAPVQSASDAACTRNDFVVCKGAYNLDITRFVKPKHGGYFTIKVVSKGVIASFCPYKHKLTSETSDVVVKYTVTTFTQPTPMPTSMPSPEPTKWSGVITNNNGLILGVGTLSTYQLMQISFGVGCFMAAVGVAFSALRQKDTSVIQLSMPISAIRAGLYGIEIVTMIFLVVTLFQFDYSLGGLIITVFRFLQMSTGCFFLLGLFGPKSVKLRIGISQLLGNAHFVTESKVYTFAAFLMILDSSFVVFLPWKQSEFAELSKGYPNMTVWAITAASAICQALVSIAAQIPFLVTDSFDMNRDFMSVINVVILSIKIAIFSSEFLMKRSVLLRKATASADGHFEDSHDGDDMGMGMGVGKETDTKGDTQNPEANADDATKKASRGSTISWTENPLRLETQANEFGESDRASLIRKVAKAEAIASEAKQEVLKLSSWIRNIMEKHTEEESNQMQSEELTIQEA